jgi:magnesium transporter
MNERIKKPREKAFSPPGSVIPVGSQPDIPLSISRIAYSGGEYQIDHDLRPEQIDKSYQEGRVTWWRVTGVYKSPPIVAIGQRLDIHPLVLEDIVNTIHRPKVEAYEDHLFYVVKHARMQSDDEVRLSQISLVQGPGWVVSFEEERSGLLDPLVERIKNGRGRIRKQGADYLAYAILDLVVDQYALCTEQLANQVDQVEDQILDDPQPEAVKRLYWLRRKTQALRSSLRPLRDFFSTSELMDSDLISESLIPFLRDTSDHVTHALETCEQLREQIALLLETYLSGLSNRMNQVMQVLTIIATIFIPLTFIAGIYGMNFEFMPELKWRFSYFVVLGGMLLVAFVMLWYFHKKKWL